MNGNNGKPTVPIWNYTESNPLEFIGQVTIVYHPPTNTFYKAKISHSADPTNEPPNQTFWSELVQTNDIINSANNANSLNGNGLNGNGRNGLNGNGRNVLNGNGGNGGNGTGNGTGNGNGSRGTSTQYSNQNGVEKGFLDKIMDFFKPKSDTVSSQAAGSTDPINGTGGNINSGVNETLNTLIIVGVGIILAILLYYFISTFLAPVNPEITAGPVQRAERAIETLVSETDIGKKILGKISGSQYSYDKVLELIGTNARRSADNTGTVIKDSLISSLKDSIDSIDKAKPIDDLIKSMKDTVENRVKDVTAQSVRNVQSSVNSFIESKKGFTVGTGGTSYSGIGGIGGIGSGSGYRNPFGSFSGQF